MGKQSRYRLNLDAFDVGYIVAKIEAELKALPFWKSSLTLVGDMDDAFQMRRVAIALKNAGYTVRISIAGGCSVLQVERRKKNASR